MEEKKQVNLFLDIELLEKAQRKASQQFMKFNAYITKLIMQDLDEYTPANAYGEDIS